MPSYLMIRLSWLETRGLAVLAWCEPCGHHARLDPGALRALKGDLGLPELSPLLRCRNCGAQDGSARPDWPATGVVARHSAAAP